MSRLSLTSTVLRAFGRGKLDVFAPPCSCTPASRSVSGVSACSVRACSSSAAPENGTDRLDDPWSLRLPLAVLKILSEPQPDGKQAMLTRRLLWEAWSTRPEVAETKPTSTRFKKILQRLRQRELIKATPNADDKRRGKSRFYYCLTDTAVKLSTRPRRREFKVAVPLSPTQAQMVNNTVALRQRALESATQKSSVYTERAKKQREERWKEGVAFSPPRMALSAPNGAALARERVQFTWGGSPVNQAERMTRGWAATNLRYVPSVPPVDPPASQSQ